MSECELKKSSGAAKYPIVEIFDSIQGEGNNMGVPCTFIRMAGCNLACGFCDSKETWKKIAANMYIDQIGPKCHKHLVVITGGEPGIQNLEPLVDALHKHDHIVAVETNGTLHIDANVDWVTKSPKAAAAYACTELDITDELKFVVDDTFSVNDINIKYMLQHFEGNIWLQPEGGSMKESWKRCYEIAMSIDNLIDDVTATLRVGVQLHQVIGLK